MIYWRLRAEATDKGAEGKYSLSNIASVYLVNVNKVLTKWLEYENKHFDFKDFQNIWHAHCSASRVSELDLGSSYWHFLWSFCGEWHFCFSNRESFHFLGYRPVIIWAVNPFGLLKNHPKPAIFIIINHEQTRLFVPQAALLVGAAIFWHRRRYKGQWWSRNICEIKTNIQIVSEPYWNRG